ncbi:MAG: ABC transporter permease [Planctomycetaceae bacterium]|nr:ABC transporter permease [Planctomycetaceae bacterium]
MILALIKSQLIGFLRDRIAVALSFALPCVMFTVFAIIFGSSAQSKPKPLQLLVVDSDQSPTSRKMAATLQTMERLQVTSAADVVDAGTGGSDSGAGMPAETPREQAIRSVRSGKFAAAVLFPKGLEDSLADFGDTDRPAVELIYDPSNPIVEQMLTGVLQASSITSAPDVLLDRGLTQFRQFGGPFTPLQETAATAMKSALSTAALSEREASSSSTDAESAGLPMGQFSLNDGIVRIRSISARKASGHNSGQQASNDGTRMISYYAAGISVMFIMFSMSGAASSLLEHQERGTLERLLSGRMRIFHLLAAHWSFSVLLGVTQISLMLVFASIVFGLELWNVETLAGAGMMAVVSSMASAAFVLMIATLCRSRKQMEGLSSIVILIMSAIGGSMMPRFIMPQFVIQLSSVAFNAWAMDGFLKVFWYNTPETSIIGSIAPEVAVILAMTTVFLMIAAASARKWSAPR